MCIIYTTFLCIFSDHFFSGPPSEHLKYSGMLRPICGFCCPDFSVLTMLLSCIRHMTLSSLQGQLCSDCQALVLFDFVISSALLMRMNPWRNAPLCCLV